jgi:hypothetical protein
VWCNRFKDGETALNDDLEKKRNRQRTLHTDENYITVEVLIREDPKVKAVELVK